MIKLEGIQGKEFKELLKVKYAISKDTTKPLLCGIHFYTKDGKLYSEAVDGYRAAQTHINYTYDDKIEFMIMDKEIKQISKQLKNDSIVSIIIDDTRWIPIVTINIDDIIISGEGWHLENDFIKIEKMFYTKRNYPNKYNLNKKELLTALKEVKKNIGNVKNNLVKLFFKEDKLQLEYHTKEGQRSSIIIPCKVEEPLEIAFNLIRLIDLLKSIDDKEIALQMISNINFVQIESKNMIGILLPLRMISDNAA